MSSSESLFPHQLDPPCLPLSTSLSTPLPSLSSSLWFNPNQSSWLPGNQCMEEMEEYEGAVNEMISPSSSLASVFRRLSKDHSWPNWLRPELQCSGCLRLLLGGWEGGVTFRGFGWKQPGSAPARPARPPHLHPFEPARASQPEPSDNPSPPPPPFLNSLHPSFSCFSKATNVTSHHLSHQKETAHALDMYHPPLLLCFIILHDACTYSKDSGKPMILQQGWKWNNWNMCSV